MQEYQVQHLGVKENAKEVNIQYKLMWSMEMGVGLVKRLNAAIAKVSQDKARWGKVNITKKVHRFLTIANVQFLYILIFSVDWLKTLDKLQKNL